MNKKVLFSELKIYAYLYIVSAPFTYLAFYIIENERNRSDGFIGFNFYIALSFWVYIKKIQPLLSEKSNAVNMILFLLLASAALFSIKAVATSAEIESNVSSIESTVSSMESDLSSLQDEVGDIKIEVADFVYR